MGESNFMVAIWTGIFVDLLINTIFDPPSGGLSFLLAVFGAQMLLLIGLALLVFLLLTRTWQFRAGKVIELMQKFLSFFAITGLHFLLFFGTRIYRIVATMSFTPHLAIWDLKLGPLPIFFILFISQKIVQLVFYRSVVQTAQAILRDLLDENTRRQA